jgi:hypothetical protein
MKVLCRRCKIQVLDRFTARCHRCLKRMIRGSIPDGTKTAGGTIVSRLAMRLARYSASDTYYPQGLTILRLDKPRLTAADDELSTLLYNMLPTGSRPEAQISDADTIIAITERLRNAEKLRNEPETRRLRALIAEVARGGAKRRVESPPLMDHLLPDVKKGIKEGLAFRETVTSRDALEEAQRTGEHADLLAEHISRLKGTLGIKELLYVEDLPMITATFGYTRRSFDPTYDELGAQHLPTEIRAFPSLQKNAAQRLGRPEIVGTIPILAREGEHEGLFLSLDPDRVVQWLAANGTMLPDQSRPPLVRILSALEPVDRYYDKIWSLAVRRLVFGLIHSISHAVMRSVSRYAGLERTSVGEYIFLPLLGCVVFDNSSSFRLGGVATLVRDHLAAFLENAANESIDCLYDPDCSDHSGACHGCLHAPEISCRVFNHGLSRSLLIGGHAPWADVSTDSQILGFWNRQAV